MPLRIVEVILAACQIRPPANSKKSLHDNGFVLNESHAVVETHREVPMAFSDHHWSQCPKPYNKRNGGSTSQIT